MIFDIIEKTEENYFEKLGKTTIYKTYLTTIYAINKVITGCYNKSHILKFLYVVVVEFVVSKNILTAELLKQCIKNKYNLENRKKNFIFVV